MNTQDKNILILIPARGGSKGIPQKNSSLLNGKPLVYYAIQNALAVEDAHVYVSTDDPKIKSISLLYGAQVLDRIGETANDEATIDDVVHYELAKLENGADKKYDIVITLQPTSPLLKKENLKKALEEFLSSDYDTIISAKEKRHLCWNKNGAGYIPMYTERVNRQKLPPFYEENGAFVICYAELVRNTKSRIGSSISVFPLSEDESIDIDTKRDWLTAESILKRKNIAFVTKGDFNMGMGHIYRSITFGTRLTEHNVYYFTPDDGDLGINKMNALNYKANIYTNEEDLYKQLAEHNIDIVINDILDTDYDYIEHLKQAGYFVVNFEDTGDGATHADLLFNALYEWSGQNRNSFFGYQYECLRDDIYLYPIKNFINENVKNVMIGFGGTDINNATQKVLESLSEVAHEDKIINLVVGIGYKYEKELLEAIKKMKHKDNIIIHKDVPFISKLIYEADLVISGNGRMVYEAVSIGTPVIVCSQNERESSHTFAKICPGIKYLGNIKDLSGEKLKKELYMVNNSYDYRVKMNSHLQEFAYEIRSGLNRIINILWDSYYRKYPA